MVLNELLQNCVDHAFPGRASGDDDVIGRIEVLVDRPDFETLSLIVRDDGVGLAPDFDIEQQRGLGTSIIRALTNSELGGQIAMRRRDDGPGSEAVVQIPLPITGR